MNKEDLLLVLLALLLLAAALTTCIFGGERSRHGYSASLLPAAMGSAATG